jgi:hypothetical protein
MEEAVRQGAQPVVAGGGATGSSPADALARAVRHGTTFDAESSRLRYGAVAAAIIAGINTTARRRSGSRRRRFGLIATRVVLNPTAALGRTASV